MIQTAHIQLPGPIIAPLERSWTVEESFRYCRRIALGHYENFPVGSLLMPAHLQPAIHSLYAFMRTADDFADEDRASGDEPERMAYLNAWEEMLTDCEQGKASHPIFIAVRETIHRYQLPAQWLHDLLTAFKMDVATRRYATYENLLMYCRYSANPVGRLILTLSGYRDEELYTLSDAICTALQLANHWQDVAVDLKKDRIYLPLEDRVRFSVTEKSLMNHTADEAFCRLLSFEVDRAEHLFATGRSLPDRVQGRLRYELRMTWLGGFQVLKKIRAVHYDVFHQRPIVTKKDWIGLGCKAVLGVLS